MKTSERRQWRRVCVFIGNFGKISHIADVSIVEFELANANWVW